MIICNSIVFSVELSKEIGLGCSDIPFWEVIDHLITMQQVYQFLGLQWTVYSILLGFAWTKYAVLKAKI